MPSTERPDLPRVHVLLAVYNGASHLQSQLDSLARQADVEVVLHVSDDGSVDGSQAIVAHFAGCSVRVWPGGARLGATSNFLKLLQAVVPQVRSRDWIAFCDQDDIWHADKLKRAVRALSGCPGDVPLAYGAATVLVDQDDRVVGFSSRVRRPCTFANSLVQCVAGANTIVMNVQAARLLSEVDVDAAFSHDWLCYQVVTGAGGLYRYDPEPCLRYRQHAENVVGSNQGLGARFKRLRQVVAGEYRDWNERNARVLVPLQHRLTAENRRRWDAFQQARTRRTPWGRLVALWRSGAYRQSAWQTAILVIACGAGRL